MGNERCLALSILLTPIIYERVRPAGDGGGGDVRKTVPHTDSQKYGKNISFFFAYFYCIFHTGRVQ